MRRLKEGEPVVRFSIVVPSSLHTRLLKRAAQETTDTETRVSPGEVCRAALEEYLDLYEGATFVKAAPQNQDAAAVPTTPKANG